MKILLWVLVAFAVAMWLSYGKKQRVRSGEPARGTTSAPALPESMVCCAHCGTYFPASEAVTSPSGTQFCCEDHRLRHSTSGKSA